MRYAIPCLVLFVSCLTIYPVTGSRPDETSNNARKSDMQLGNFSISLNVKDVNASKEFYEKHGGKTIIYARFVPIVRTFAPFIAGVAEMNYATFAKFNVFGGIGWVVLTTMAGYYVGDNEFVRKHFEKVLVGIVLISLAPIAIEYFRSRKNRH